jgi:hypothetical protein
MINILRRYIWKIFGKLLYKLGFRAETNKDKSSFYIFRK